AVAPTLRVWLPAARARYAHAPARLRLGLERSASPNRRRDSCGSPRYFGGPAPMCLALRVFLSEWRKGAYPPAPFRPQAVCQNGAAYLHLRTDPLQGELRIPSALLVAAAPESLQTP